MLTVGRPLVLVGGGGHCNACIEVIEVGAKFTITGIVDTKDKLGTKIHSYKVFATDEDLPMLVGKPHRYFHIALGGLEFMERRRQLFEQLKGLDARLPIILSPFARVSRRALMGEGSIAMNGVIVNVGAKVGKNCIINTAAVVEHDSTVGDQCHISTGGIINGGCRIGDNVFIGSGAVVSNGCSIASGAIIGAGAAVIRSIEEPGTYVGVPARRVK